MNGGRRYQFLQDLFIVQMFHKGSRSSFISLAEKYAVFISLFKFRLNYPFYLGMSKISSHICSCVTLRQSEVMRETGSLIFLFVLSLEDNVFSPPVTGNELSFPL